MLLFVLDNKYLAAVHEKSFCFTIISGSHSQKLGARKFQSSRREEMIRPITNLTISIPFMCPKKMPPSFEKNYKEVLPYI